MKHHNSKKTLKILLLTTVTLLLSSCGSSSSKDVAEVSIDHPQFSQKAITESPSYNPSGDITQLAPSFSWNAIENATDYVFGHENIDATEWHSYKVTSNETGCESIEDICSYTPSDYNFPVGVKKVWWVLAKVNGEWQQWSRPIVFIIKDEVSTDVGVATQIKPSGTIGASQKEFSWSSVSGAIEYKIGYEDADTAKGWVVTTISASAANCTSVEETCVKEFLYSSLPTNHISWWIKAKNTSGIWGDWSAGLTFTVDSKAEQIPDAPYQFLCNGIDNRPPIGNLEDGVVVNGKRYFLAPDNEKKLMISNEDGTNIKEIIELPRKPTLASVNGALYYKWNNQLWRVADANSVHKILSYISGFKYGNSEPFSYANGFDIYSHYTQSSRGTNFSLRLFNQSSNKTKSLISTGYFSNHQDSLKEFYETYYYEGRVYYKQKEKGSTERITGVINIAGELEPIDKCN